MEATNLHNFYNPHSHKHTHTHAHAHTRLRHTHKPTHAHTYTHTHSCTLQFLAKAYFVNYDKILTINRELSADLDKIVSHLSIFILSTWYNGK